MAKRPGIHVNMSDDLRKRFKSACVQKDTTMTDVVIELVEKWLEVNEVPTTPVMTEKPDRVAIIVQQNFWTLREHNIKNIDAIAKGAAPTKADIMRISSILNLDQGELLSLAKDEFGKLPPSNPKEKDTNGCNSAH